MKFFHMTLPGHPEATLDGYLLDMDLAMGQYTRRPAIVVCPGGGYVYCSRAEGEPVAMAYAARGFHTFVFKAGNREYSLDMDKLLESNGETGKYVLAFTGGQAVLTLDGIAQ
jgi:hypothetical protein